MPNTITTYTTFTAGTKAKAAEVNTNFSNYRGTIVPVNTDTASSSDGVHDLGSSEHRWQDGYMGTINLVGSTSTTDVSWAPQTSSTAGAVDLKFGSSTISTFDTKGIPGGYIYPRDITSLGSDPGEMGIYRDFVVGPGFTSGAQTHFTTAKVTLRGNGAVHIGLSPTAGPLVAGNGYFNQVGTSIMNILAGLTTTALSTISSCFLAVEGATITGSVTYPVASFNTVWFGATNDSYVFRWEKPSSLRDAGFRGDTILVYIYEI
jgi:hypothetical protein